MKDFVLDLLLDALYLAAAFVAAVATYQHLGTAPWVRVFAISNFLGVLAFRPLQDWWTSRFDQEVPDGKA